MSTFNADAWQHADVNSNDSNDPPDPGSYEVAVHDADAFTSKAGNDIVKVEYRVLTGPMTGHTWAVISGFKSEAATGVTKSMCSRLGVNIDMIASLDELNHALQNCIGQYYLVDVAQNGQYRNTYINSRLEEKTPASDIPAAGQGDFQHASAGGDDEKIPF